MADLTITTQDDLPGPGDDRPYVMFVNQTEYGIGKFLRTNVLSARPDLKRFTSIRFRMTLKRHPSDSAGENEPGTSRSLKTLPGIWSDLALACLIHVGMKRLTPNEDSGLGIEAEYEEALRRLKPDFKGSGP